MPKMRRQIFVHLLFVCFLLAASPFNLFTANVQAIRPVEFKLRTEQTGSMQHSGHVIPSWVDEKKIHKSPSGPNPIGNHRPPARP